MDWFFSSRASRVPAIAFAAIAFAVVAAVVQEAHADALVVSQAMRASTIIEIFIEENQVRTEIEIGAADVAAFADVLPNELYRSSPIPL